MRLRSHEWRHHSCPKIIPGTSGALRITGGKVFTGSKIIQLFLCEASATGRTSPCSIHMHRKLPRVSLCMIWSCFATAYAWWVEAFLTHESINVWRVWFRIAAAA